MLIWQPHVSTETSQYKITISVPELSPQAFLVAQLLKNLPAIQETACSSGDEVILPGSGRSSGEGNSNPFQYSCLGNPMDRGAWRAIVYGVARVRHNLTTKPPPTELST